MTYLLSINWPIVVISALILGSIIGFFVYFFRLLLKAIKIYISKNRQI